MKLKLSFIVGQLYTNNNHNLLKIIFNVNKTLAKQTNEMQIIMMLKKKLVTSFKKKYVKPVKPQQLAFFFFF